MVNLGVDITPGTSVSGGTVLYNRGNAPATLSGIDSSAEFKTLTNCPAILQAGEKCSIAATFSSYVPKTHMHTIAISTGTGGSAIPLTFYATVKSDAANRPALAFDKSSLEFGPLPVGQSATKTVMLGNTGTAPAVLAPFGQSPEFGVQSNCPLTLSVGAQCTVSVTFTAITAGPPLGFIVAAQAQDNVQAKLLSQGSVVSDATGPAPRLELSPSTLAFAPLPTTQAAVLRAKVTNTGELAASVKDIGVDYGSDVFSQVNDCGTSIAPAVSCSITVTFKPLAAEPRNGRVRVALIGGTDAGLVLEGTGQAATLTAPGVVNFETSVLPNSSVSRAVGLGNVGNIPLTGLSLSNKDSRLTVSPGDCSSTLEPKQGCTLMLQYAPSTEGVFDSNLLVSSSNGGTQTIRVTGTAVRLSAAPANLTFSETRAGSSSAGQSVTLTNDGQTAVALGDIGISDGRANFDVTRGCGTTLAAQSSCLITVRYAPTAVKANEFTAQQGALSIFVGHTEVGRVGLSGTTSNPQLELSHTTVSADAASVGTSAAPVSFTVNNPTKGAVSVTGMGIVSGETDFAQSNNCGTELAAGSNCTVTVQFTPAQVGLRTGLWTAVTSLGPYGVPLSGNGTLALTMSSTSLRFAPTNVGKSSSPYTVILTNPTTVTASFARADEGMGVSAGSSDFGQSNNCGAELVPGASCSANIQFTPKTAGERVGQWSVASSFGVAHVQLGGLGSVPEGHIDAPDDLDTPPVTPGDGFTHFAIKFLRTEVGQSSDIRNIVFTNKGTGPLAVKGISQESGDTDFRQSNNCGAELAPGASCTISLLFTPSAIGPRTGTVILLSDTGNYLFELSGDAIGATGTWTAQTSADFGPTELGTVVTRAFTLTNTGSVTARNVLATVSGADVRMDKTTCGSVGSPITLAAGNSCAVSLTYSPLVHGSLKDGVLVAAGTWAGGPISISLKGEAPLPKLEFIPPLPADLGTIRTAESVTRTFVLQNSGLLPDVLTDAPTVTGAGFARTGGTCAKDLKLPVDGTCTVTLSLTAASVGPQSGEITATSTQGASVSVTVTAKAEQSVLSMSGTAGASQPPETTLVSTNLADGVTRNFYLRDETGLANVAANKVTLSGASAFSVTGVDVVTYAEDKELVCSFTARGTSSPCSATAKARAIRVQVTFVSTSEVAQTATLRIESNGSEGAQELSLSGRYTSGDPYADKVTLLMHMEGKQGDSTFIDEKGSTLVKGSTGNPTNDTTLAKFGSASASFNGNGDFLTSTSTAGNLGSEDFTVEGFVYLKARTSIFPAVFSNYTAWGGGAMALFAGHASADTSRYQVALNGIFPAIQSNTTITYNTWTHLAVVRKAGIVTLYVNGVANGTREMSLALPGNGSWFLGTAGDSPTAGYLNGNIDEFRVTRGVARYTGNFAVPSTPFRLN